MVILSFKVVFRFYEITVNEGNKLILISSFNCHSLLFIDLLETITNVQVKKLIITSIISSPHFSLSVASTTLFHAMRKIRAKYINLLTGFIFIAVAAQRLNEYAIKYFFNELFVLCDSEKIK
jgi:hypothetical protein